MRTGEPGTVSKPKSTYAASLRHVAQRLLAELRLSALVLASAATMAFADDCVVSATQTGSVTLRSAPTSSGSTAVGAIGPGEYAPLIASLRGWYEVRLADGRSAYAAKRSTSVAECVPAVAVAAAPVVGLAAEPFFELHAIDVGTGLSVLVRGPGFAVLYDAGSNDDVARGENNRVVAYLRSLKPALQSLTHVVLSHPHRDHVELLPDVVANFKPQHVWNSGAYNDICGYRNFLLAIAASASIQYHTASDDAGDAFIDLPQKTCYGQKQAKQTLKVTHAARITDEKIILGPNASMSFLYADGSKRPSYNENSLVVRFELGAKRVLLVGDAEAGGRKAPSEQPNASSIEGKLLACCTADLKADVLVVGHHGSKTSSRTQFLDAVGARVFIVSSGPTKYATVILPDAEVIAELESRGQLFRTDLEDDACATSPDKIGPDADGKAGGCDNISIALPATSPLSAEYRRLSD